MIEYRLTGWEDLKQRLSELPAKMQRSILVPAVREAAKTVQEAARAKAPVAQETIVRSTVRKTGKSAGKSYKARIKPGTLKRSITAKQKRKNARGEVIFLVGPSSRAYYGQFVERGHVLRRTRKGPVVGTVPPYPFLKPALEENAQKALGIIRQRVEDGINRLAAK